VPSYEIAHIREQGVDMIIVPLESSFGLQSDQAQRGFIAELTRRARGARLAGGVVPVWEEGSSFAFIAPPNWHGFFRSIDMFYVGCAVNKTLSW
jgi:hypothetical protein